MDPEASLTVALKRTGNKTSKIHQTLLQPIKEVAMAVETGKIKGKQINSKALSTCLSKVTMAARVLGADMVVAKTLANGIMVRAGILSKQIQLKHRPQHPATHLHRCPPQLHLRAILPEVVTGNPALRLHRLPQVEVHTRQLVAARGTPSVAVRRA